MSTPLSAMRTSYGGRWAALIAVTLSMLVPMGASASAAAPAAPPAAEAEPNCVTWMSPVTKTVTGGTLKLCRLDNANLDLYLGYTNTGRGLRNLTAVVYDCEGSYLGDRSVRRCADSLKGTYVFDWRQVQGGETVEAIVPKGSVKSHLYWTDNIDQATNMKWEAAAWIPSN
ncbi:hypothetical protein [Streptomyces sp. NPDC058953]|uniref:hypothetical protein n=1 Tax=unclassified Streptomyces TaxID=2593676 RepID=UPI0036BE1EA7